MCCVISTFLVYWPIFRNLGERKDGNWTEENRENLFGPRPKCSELDPSVSRYVVDPYVTPKILSEMSCQQKAGRGDG